jgi:hypothetical protein
MLLHKGKFLLLVVVLSLMVTVPVLAAAPGEGIVVEGEQVPGVALGDSRAQVEVAYGEPESCQTLPYYNGPPHGLNGICRFDMDGGGQVTVHYFSAEGGPAQDSPDDIVFHIRWYDVDGWVTTAGINTTLALADPQAVVDAYPEAEVTYNFGSIIRVRDTEMGIEVIWNNDFKGGLTTVNMSIFTPYTPEPPPDMIRVADIEMTADRRSVTAKVLILDDQDQPVEGAVVDATWTYPKVDGLQVSGATDIDGYVTFKIDKARRGAYYLNIDNVSLEGYVYDYINSITLGVILKNK